MIQQVILVNEKDEIHGTAEKMEAHQKGLLHRAFSVFIFNRNGEMLLQQRALSKYHSGGLWTNACCSHPSPGGTLHADAQKRLLEEMGFETPLQKVFEFVYRAEFENGLTEYEYDHVLAGQYDGAINYNTGEVMDVCYRSMEEIKKALDQDPQQYTVWFRLAFPGVEEWAKRGEVD